MRSGNAIQLLSALWGTSANADREAMPSLPSRLARGVNLSVNA
jgi:hypothetical protein